MSTEGGEEEEEERVVDRGQQHAQCCDMSLKDSLFN